MRSIDLVDVDEVFTERSCRFKLYAALGARDLALYSTFFFHVKGQVMFSLVRPFTFVTFKRTFCKEVAV